MNIRGVDNYNQDKGVLCNGLMWCMECIYKADMDDYWNEVKRLRELGFWRPAHWDKIEMLNKKKGV